ncbi:MAG: hypothetical protein KatS3mg043_0952 [Rhodothermaceae bacterium]|nr:MAG: hypothetical protein KatS3mg043_0952 [Rhodothermaceae bacterium]
MRVVRALCRFGCLGLLLAGMFQPAQAQRYQFDIYSIEDGLAQSQPITLHQSRNGYLWIGTFGGGLSRFDGRVFTNFSKRDGLPSGLIYDIAEDAAGRLWLATAQGAGRYDGRAFTGVDLGIAPQRIYAVLVDRSGTVWFATETEGVVRWVPDDTTAVMPVSGLPGEKALALLEAGRAVWIGTPAGVCRHDAAGLACFTEADGLPHASVHALAHDRSGRIWMATGKGLAVYDGTSLTAFRPDLFAELRISALWVDRRDRLWVGTSQGLFRIEGDAITSFGRENGLAKPVMSLHEDREGNLWIGIDGMGLARFSPSPFLLFNSEHGLAEDGTWAILEDRHGHIWFGTSGSGVSRFDGQAFTTFTTADGLTDNTVFALFEDTSGTLWLGTGAGLTRYDGHRFRQLPGLQASVWALAGDDRGTLWIGTGGAGLYRYAQGHLTPFTEKDGLPGKSVNALYLAEDGSLWIGTRQGLAHYADGRFTTYTTADGLPGNDVSTIQPDGHGGLWLGTYGGGLAHFIPPSRPGGPFFRTVSLEDGLVDDHIMSMVRGPQGHLWFCTNQGLTRLDLDQYTGTGEVVLEHYGVAEGFVGRECNAGSVLHDRKGQLWFGTVKGVIRYTPGQRLENPYPPHILITDVRLFFGQVSWAPYAEGVQPGTTLPAGLRLPHDKNSVTFDYVGINLTQPREVAYQYQLVGADETWTPITHETSATYANLPPGAYTFRVRAVNGSGVWNEVPATFSFVITPPFWQTGWFYLLMALLGVGGAYGLITARERNLRQSRQHLEAMVVARTKELRQEKEKVEAANEKLKLLSLVVRETQNVVIIADTTGRVEWVNEALTRASGYTLETLRQEIGENIRDIYRNPALEEAIRRAVEEQASSVFESKRHRPDGTEIWVSSTLSPITDGQDRVTKLVLIDTDITERKVLEQELVAAREAALEAARAKSDFLANMSHEIRTPMNGVIGMTSLLLDTKLTPEQKEFVEVIRNSGNTLLAIIQDILDFSKIEAGKIELEEQDFALHEVVEEALDLVATKAVEKQLELAYVIEEGVPPTVRGDMTRLRQILTNLLSNAVKFTDAGEVSVHLDAEPLGEGRYRVHTAVRDTGIGIPADRIDRLFQSFSQVDASTTRRYGGTGLGLAISKRLVELMGGTIWVESEEGAGSTFHFTVVLEAIRPAEPPPCPTQVAGRRALVVDDHPVNRRMLTLQLARWGMHVEAVASAAAALARLDAGETFDVALLDMQMPEMDGLMLARALRLRPATHNLPLVILSSMGQRADTPAMGLVAWLTKPIKQKRLLEVLCRALDPHQEIVTAQQDDPFGSGEARSLRILLAEDNLVNQKVIQQFLKRMGYRADTVANGLEVLDAFKRSPYDVILMDVQMPEMDGLEATRRIRADYAPDRQPRIIAITANATRQDQQLCLEAGMDDYISKPVRVEALRDALARAGTAVQRKATPATDASPATGDVLNLDRLQEATGHDADFIREVLSSYLEETPQQLAAMRQALEQADWKTLERLAHTLKSSSGTCGAEELARACEQLEAGAGHEPAERLAQHLETVLARFERARQAIRSYLAPHDREAAGGRSRHPGGTVAPPAGRTP